MSPGAGSSREGGTSPEQRLRSAAGVAAAGMLLGRLSEAIEHARIHRLDGRVQQVTGTLVRATLAGSPRIGELCHLRDAASGETRGRAEVIGIEGPVALLATLGDVAGISTRTAVVRDGAGLQAPVGAGLMGRVLDALGQPADGRPLDVGETAPLQRPTPDLLRRRLIEAPLVLGVAAIDAMLTCGEGQRLGIFGSAGTGKSSLLATIVKSSDAEVVVVGLIGERGREVREFVDRDLGPEGLARAIVVCATADRPPMERVKAAYVATAIAEHFRDQGKRVLLLIDSVTRFARALREVGLLAGEPPARRGFPASVFAVLPTLFERAGTGETGSITAFYTVLVEDDETVDPIGEEVRSLLDGHIVLSRKLAEAGHFPAIDVLASISRVMRQITGPEHQQAAAYVRQLLACFQQNELLIRIGEYEPGADLLLDEALEKIDAINALLQRQGPDSRFDDIVATLQELGTPLDLADAAEPPGSTARMPDT